MLTAAQLHRDLFPAGARRALALASHRRDGGLHYYAGSALNLQIADDVGAALHPSRTDLAAGEVPQATVRRKRGRLPKAPATGR